ncbi:MAG: AhpC/TSA family protein [Bacteroides sp.]|nr:AhpC/TSA family protein [Bacteroides sp.]
MTTKSLRLMTLGLLLGSGMSAMADAYKVSGTIGGHSGRVYLLRPVTLEVSDTIGTTVVSDGSFSFSGDTDVPFEAEIAVERSIVRIPLIIEPDADISIKASAKTRFYEVSGGGELQQCNNRFNAIRNASQAERDSVRREFIAGHDMQIPENRKGLQRRMEEVEAALEKAEDEFIAANDNMVAPSIIARRLDNITRAKTLHRKVSLLGPVALATERGKMLKEYADRSSHIAVGGVAPDFTMGTPDGGTLSLYGVKAKVKILDFWASWCHPCRAENPNLKKIYDKYHDRGLEIISVSLDTARAPWVRAIEKDGMNWLHASDLEEGTTARDVYEVYGIPYMLILDENNRIISDGLRGEALEKFIASQFEN